MQDSAFLYIGTDKESFPLAVPYPTIGNGVFESVVNVVTQETSNGRIVGQLRGKTRLAQTVGWSRIDPETWWEICRWFEKNGPFCYVKYFSHNLGEWKEERFLCTKFSCTPILHTAGGAPRWYEDAKFQLQSTGG